MKKPRLNNARNVTAALSLLALTGLTVAAPAHAADGFQAGDWLIRARGLAVTPDESSTISAIGGKAHAENTVVPEVNISYFITDTFALELIAAVTKHDMEARGTTLGTVNLGNVWLLPPTLTIQYHWSPVGNVSPYVGVGLNYTNLFNADAPGGAVTSIKYGDSVGPAVQAGFDLWLNENWTFNADIKKIWVNTDVSINGGAIKADVDLDPWIFGIGFGYRF